jgi:hypothetical protein
VTVERAHRGTGVRIVIDGDEREPARFAGHAVHHEADFSDLAMLLDKIMKIVLGVLKREITYVQFHLCLSLEKLSSYRAVTGNRVTNLQ